MGRGVEWGGVPGGIDVEGLDAVWVRAGAIGVGADM